MMIELVKEIYSPRKTFKVEINKRVKDGLFEIDVYKWDSEWETWLQHSSGFSLTDNLNSALSIADEKLKVYSGENIEGGWFTGSSFDNKKSTAICSALVLHSSSSK